MKEGFICGRDKVVDMVTLSMKYGCLTFDNTEDGWSQSYIPTIHVNDESKAKSDERITEISLDTKGSVRWSLAINAEEIEDFTFKGTMTFSICILILLPSLFIFLCFILVLTELVAPNLECTDNSGELVPRDEKISMDGWFIIQYSGGKNAPTKFDLNLFWAKNSTRSAKKVDGKGEHLLLKLRTDFDRLTARAANVLSKLPSWCSLFGKSTSPQTLSFLNSLPVNY